MNCGCLGLHPSISSTKGTAAFHDINGDRCLQTCDLMIFFPQGLKHWASVTDSPLTFKLPLATTRDLFTLQLSWWNKLPIVPLYDSLIMCIDYLNHSSSFSDSNDPTFLFSYSASTPHKLSWKLSWTLNQCGGLACEGQTITDRLAL